MGKDNPRKPFKVICSNCNKEQQLEHQKSFTDKLKEEIDVSGSAFYDSAIVTIECDCGNEIEL